MVPPSGRGLAGADLGHKKNGFAVEEKMGVIFVPLIGKEGFGERQI